MHCEINEMLEPVYRLSKDTIAMMRRGQRLSKAEMRFLVDAYYATQKFRIRTNNQIKGLIRDASKEDKEPEAHTALAWLMAQQSLLERELQKSMAIFTETHAMAWFFAQTLGVGPVLSAGLLAHIDIDKATTAGHIWRFAGLDPTLHWEKKTKRPFNASLKTLCWKIGDSFVKVSGRSDAYYGQLYRKRKEYEIARNDAGELANQAAAKLEAHKIGKDTDAYKHYSTGKLPPAHIDQRARRYAVKLFLAHLYQRWREEENLPVAAPYSIAHQQHAHWIEPPQIKVVA